MNLNSWQIFNYLETYSVLSSEFPVNKMRLIQQQFSDTNSKFARLFKQNDPDQDAMKIVLQEYVHFQQQVIQMCRELWIKFDLDSMIVGCFILILSNVFLALYLYVGGFERFPFRSLGMFCSKYFVLLSKY